MDEKLQKDIERLSKSASGILSGKKFLDKTERLLDNAIANKQETLMPEYRGAFVNNCRVEIDKWKTFVTRAFKIMDSNPDQKAEIAEAIGELTGGLVSVDLNIQRGQEPYYTITMGGVTFEEKTVKYEGKTETVYPCTFEPSEVAPSFFMAYTGDPRVSDAYRREMFREGSENFENNLGDMQSSKTGLPVYDTILHNYPCLVCEEKTDGKTQIISGKQLLECQESFREDGAKGLDDFSIGKAPLAPDDGLAQ